MSVWQQLLGKTRQEIEPLLDSSLGISLNSAQDVKEYKDGATYFCFYDLGIALCFIKGRLDSVDFYSRTARSNSQYSQVGEHFLPLDIVINDTGLSFVNKFGEPSEKGGANGINIWLRWAEAGLEAQFPTRNWDDAKNQRWSSITIYIC